MGMAYADPGNLASREFTAGATRGTIELVAPEGHQLSTPKFRPPGGVKALYWAAFPPGGARLARKGSRTSVLVQAPGSGRVAALVAAHRFRPVEGHSAKVWHLSTSACEGGLLLVAQPGLIFEAAAYKRPWRRFRLDEVDGLVEVVQEEAVID